MGTKTQLVIEGGLVTKKTLEDGKNHDGSRWIRETDHGTVPLERWLDAQRAQDGELSFLPPISMGHIVARKARGNKSFVVAQLPPAVRSFFYSPDKRLYRVAMPYLIFGIRFIGEAVDAQSTAARVGVFLYYRNEPISSLDDVLAYPNMPNIYENAALCWGTERIGLDLPLGRKVEKVVEAFFASNFNSHELGDQWQPAKREVAGHPQSFQEWESLTQADPSFITKLPWRNTGKSVRQILEEGVK